MTGKHRFSRWLLGAALFAALDCAGVIAIETALVTPAQAQFPFFGGQQQQHRSRSGGGFFGGLFGGFDRHPDPYEQQQAPVDNSRAPPPRKADPKADPITVTTSVVVLGDAMADWLASGMEDAFSDSPEIAIVRKNKLHSGLIRYDQKSDLDWGRVARDILAQEKANYVVMMLGVSDRQSIRGRDTAKEAEKKKGKDHKDQKDQADKPAAEKEAQNKEQSGEQETAATAPETQPGKKTGGVAEFRTDQWAEIYSKRIDETIAALKSKGVPVFWVGLPSMRGAKATADTVYLNDLYRARAERAGVVYIDIWDGFVDESGKYSNFGPDYEGQVRRLRSQDGVYFTKFGALKLAHYVAREIRRHMNSRVTPVALPSGPLAPTTPDGKPAARPVAGAVIPLTVMPGNSEELLGGAGNSSPQSDAIATRVLVKGEPVDAPRGRADNFALQPRNDDSSAAPPAVTPAGSLAAAPAEAARIEPAATEAAPSPEKKTSAPRTTSAEPRTTSAERTAQNTASRPRPPRPPQRDDVPRPPLGIPFSGGWPFR
jgi:uncharacterized protein